MVSLLLDQVPEFGALAFLLACSAFFSGAETALFSLTPEERHRMARRPIRSGQLIRALLRDPPALLSAILFGNMVVNVSFYAVSILVATRIAAVSHAAAAAAAVVSLLVVIIFGEVSPKGIAVGYPLRFAQVVAPVLYVFCRVVRPATWVLKWFARTFSGLLVAPLPRHPLVTREELKMLMGLAEDHGVLDSHTRDMIEQVVELAQVRVNEVMVPRVDMPMFNLAQDREAFNALVRVTHEERIPVYDGTRDNVVGMVVAREVLLRPERDIRSFIRPVRFVPETQTTESLLRRFRETQEPIAVVVDEYGGTAGMVTLEHLLEEIVGDLRGEFEPDKTPVQRLDEDTYLLAGDLNTHEWRQLLGVGFDPPGIETVAGFAISLLGKIPEEGDTVEWRGLRFVVEKMSGRRVLQVSVQRMRDHEEAPDA